MRYAGRVLMVLVAAAFVGAGTLAAQQPPAQDPASPQSVQAEAAKETFVRAYRIGPGDLLEIRVFEVEQLSQTVRVSEDGSITLPLLGRVVVEGLTQEGVAQKLAGLLQAKYVKNPQVTIFIREYKNQQVAVIGAVENAGNYELVGRRNLLQIISMAGGFAENCAETIFVLREAPDGTTSTIPIDLKDLMINGNQELNIPILPNDVINVPVDREIRVFVMGKVNNPGAVTAKLSEGVTLFQAVANAGGLAEGARPSAVTVTRKGKTGVEQKFHINLRDIIKGKKKDFLLQEGDVVYVPGSFW